MSKHSAPTSSPEMPADYPDIFPIVGIGASAGGLQTCRRLLEAMPDGRGMACILVQHLDPTHESLMVGLLADHTGMTVLQARDGMRIVRNHLYTIPPGCYLSVRNGTLQLSQPNAAHGARLPFDFLLRSMAEAFGQRAVCVVLSGSGSDGSLGLGAIRQHHGLVIAQQPGDAECPGMPASAIETGDVDLVLPIAHMPQAIQRYAAFLADGVGTGPSSRSGPAGANRAEQKATHLAQTEFVEIISLLRSETEHDFTFYKPGTLERRLARRMAMITPPPADISAYVALLRTEPDERERLAKDLLIHVTSFFRDSKVFDLLALTAVPDLISRHAEGEPLRIWVAGCSTGEETYSLAMLLREQIAASGRDIKLQMFASDIDAEAVAIAREGLYPASAAAQISADRLQRFFAREGPAYRVQPALRAAVVFTVQDVLSDPPFSRLDMISCRNLLIYLRPDAQASLISLFHFALRQDGLLLLGIAETVGVNPGLFAVVDKTARLYRNMPASRGGLLTPVSSFAEGPRTALRLGPGRLASRSVALADLCRRLVLDAYAPAALLINGKRECLYSLGPVDRYLRMAPGLPSNDVLAMARPGMRLPLRQAIEQAALSKARVVAGGHLETHGGISFSIEVHPVPSDELDLLLLCFVETPMTAPAIEQAVVQPDNPHVLELEQQLEATRAELQQAVRNLEISSEEQSEINEEALSVNEEYQSTNEELMASKEELQSLNEELTALNGQLQATLEHQRTTTNDLQNVLFSTDVATLFLDTALNIRFFTPATRTLFNVIPGDIGRPIADLNSQAIRGSLPEDAREVIAHGGSKEQEIRMPDGAWFTRRILPYRTHENTTAGVVITFVDITERKSVAKALEEAKLQADIANHAKSRFLAAASHDLRQPLQTLALLAGVLAKTVVNPDSKALVVRLDEALSGISGMLNTLLDINEIETGSLHAEMMDFPVNTLLERLRDQFNFHAAAQNLSLRVVPCSAIVHSDPRLLEQMIRNLLANALKYTSEGKVLLGCRRHQDMLSIEVWDTGAGIPEPEHAAIFEEYHQLNNAARDRSRGLGLGLSIVRQIGKFLNHNIRLRSVPGKGSCFSIEISIPSQPVPEPEPKPLPPLQQTPLLPGHRTADILLIEDDLSVRNLLAQLLSSEGHRITAASDGPAALDLVRQGGMSPDLILTDYNLPNGMDGVTLTTTLRAELQRAVPVIVLTGDISKETLRNIAVQNSVQLNKPVKPAELSTVIQRMLPSPAVAPFERTRSLAPVAGAVITIIDDDESVRAAMRMVFEMDGYAVESFESAEAFLDSDLTPAIGCLLVDAYLPGMSGLDLLRRLSARKHRLPTIMITGRSDVPMAVAAMKCGAADFIEKPASPDDLLDAVGLALDHARDSSKLLAWQESASKHIGSLTERQHEVMDMVLAGHPSKNIAADLGISQRTVENHRASIMRKTGSKSLPALARLALAAAADKT